MFKTSRRILKHLWLDANDSRRALPPQMLTRLMQRVAASEQRHSGEIRICVEAGLPWSYLWRHAAARERAVTLFGKLRVWDTAHNNGVLIYLLMADQAIEIVADRGLNDKVSPAQWHDMLERMRGAFKQRLYEEGLTQAVAEISALLVAHFPLHTGATNLNELPDQPLLR
jgi:uncharacterized membrane protein